MVKPLSFLSDRFRWFPFKWDIQRNDEVSGTGDGRYWQASLAPELWRATVFHMPLLNSVGEELDAVIRSLRGAQEAFFMASSLFCAPKSDPSGAGLVGANVTLLTIAANRAGAAFSGLPAGFVLSTGDKFSVAYGERFYFGEIGETAPAAANGTTANLSIFPNFPAGVTAGAVVTLIKPACKVVVVPGSHKPGDIDGRFTKGGSFQIIQKK
ncbi:hypothetical protein RMS29_028295 (plasmid) [Agrobacterium rosae]|uniref:Uncharacterized protein n=1 Tax=Agrobacterium rosae TaxID=1972867 RepID=A0ABU4W536_9HYPH|nr:hypothetical protein [Agrobacterium rosae]MDX8332888.1 hypothetical protein [Agrobacterium rosae]